MYLKSLLQAPFGALALPVAPWGEEVLVPLPAELEMSEGVPVQFPEPVILVGVHPTVIQNGPQDEDETLLVPTLDDVAVQLSTNRRDFWTAQNRGSEVNGDPGEQWNTLSMLGVKERYLWIHLSEATPLVNLKCKWKRFTQGTPHYTDALVGIGFFVIFPNRLSPEAQEQLLGKAAQ